MDPQTCIACTKVTHDPWMLPCLHSLCRECLAKSGKDHRSTLISCPACAETFFSQSVISAARLPTAPCAECVDTVSSTVIARCEQCDVHLCSVHAEIHERVKRPPHRLTTAAAICVAHPKRIVTAFCERCQLVVCLDCMNESHRSHSVHSLEHAATKYFNAIDEQAKQLRDQFHTINLGLTQLDQQYELLRNRLSFIEREVSEPYEQVSQQLHAFIQNLTLLTAQLQTERIKAVAKAEAELTSDLKCVQLQREGLEQIREHVVFASRQTDIAQRAPLADLMRLHGAINSRLRLLNEARPVTQPLISSELHFVRPVLTLTTPVITFGRFERFASPSGQTSEYSSATKRSFDSVYDRPLVALPTAWPEERAYSALESYSIQSQVRGSNLEKPSLDADDSGRGNRYYQQSRSLSEDTRDVFRPSAENDRSERLSDQTSVVDHRPRRRSPSLDRAANYPSTERQSRNGHVADPSPSRPERSRRLSPSSSSSRSRDLSPRPSRDKISPERSTRLDREQERGRWTGARSFTPPLPPARPLSGTHFSRDYTKIAEPKLLIGKRGTAEGEFLSPRGMAVTPKGRLIVADTTNHRVQVLTSDGRHLRTFKVACEVGSVAANEYTGEVWYSRRSQNRIVSLALEGDGPENRAIRCVFPRNFTFLSDGSVVVSCADRENSVRLLRPSGIDFEEVWLSPHSCNLKRPHGVLCKPDANELYVCDYDNNRIQILALDSGKPVRIVADGRVINPTSIAFTREYLLVVSEGASNCVSIWTRQGDFVHAWKSHFDFPAAVSVLPDDSIAVLDKGHSVIKIF